MTTASLANGPMLDPELTPLLSHPSRRVEIPLVIVILDGASCCFDVGPLEFLANCTLYCRAHKMRCDLEGR